MGILVQVYKERVLHMSMDRLQEAIRKRKNPTVLELLGELPPQLLEEGKTPVQAYEAFCQELLTALAEEIPALRLSFARFALMGPQGLEALERTLKLAKKLGYYVLLDGPELLRGSAAELAAQALLGRDGPFACDGVILGVYAGSDVVEPFLPYCRQEKKTVFVVARTANRSAPELQDLITGSRLVHTAAADLALRFGDQAVGKRGYGPVGLMVSAGSADSVRQMRRKYPQQFLLLDGFDAPRANAKNCSYCFNKYGWGGGVCSGTEISAAWKKAESDGTDYVQQAVEAAQRMKRNLNRYITMV